VNPALGSRGEAAARALLGDSGDAELEALSLKLGLTLDTVARGAPRATRASMIWKLAKEQGGTTLVSLEEILADQLGKPAPLYWLYVSCSEEDRKDPLLGHFYDDLSARLRALVKMGAGEIRYLDEGNPGDSDTWSPWALRAMQRTRVLVCLYSSGFFASPYCGRVWSAFLRRLRAHAQIRGGGASPPLIFPVAWKPPADNPAILPKVVRTLPRPPASPGPPYAEAGLRSLVQQVAAKRPGSEVAYADFVDKLAREIVDAATASELQEDFDVPALKDIDSVFHVPFQAGTVAPDTGPEYAKFVFVAAKKKEIDALRESAGYDETSERWQPYHPISSERLGIISFAEAARANMQPATIPLDSDTNVAMKAADDSGNILLVVVDPWTVQLRTYSEFISQNHKFLLKRSNILVCWNDADEETASQRGNLLKSLALVFNARLEGLSPRVFRNQIISLSDLRGALADALLSARRQLVDDAPNPRVAEGLTFVRPNNVVAPVTPPPIADVAFVVKAERDGVAPLAQPRLEGPSGGTRI
jgi:FxsC-like protein